MQRVCGTSNLPILVGGGERGEIRPKWALSVRTLGVQVANSARRSDQPSRPVVEPRVRALLAEHPDLPATVIAERVGWTGSSSWVRDNVARLRPEHRRVDPADRLTWEAGDAAQCDLWFPPEKIPLENGTSMLLPVLVITAAYSRFVLARMIPTKTTEDLLLGTCAHPQRRRLPAPQRRHRLHNKCQGRDSCKLDNSSRGLKLGRRSVSATAKLTSLRASSTVRPPFGRCRHRGPSSRGIGRAKP